MNELSSMLSETAVCKQRSQVTNQEYKCCSLCSCCLISTAHLCILFQAFKIETELQLIRLLDDDHHLAEFFDILITKRKNVMVHRNQFLYRSRFIIYLLHEQNICQDSQINFFDLSYKTMQTKSLHLQVYLKVYSEFRFFQKQFKLKDTYIFHVK